MREAPSLSIIERLLSLGAEVAAYDPVALAQARSVLGARPGLRLLDQVHAVLEDADALVIVTEWKEFRSPTLHTWHAHCASLSCSMAATF